MQTLVLRIPDDLARDLEAEASRTNLTKSEVARRRLISAAADPKETDGGFRLIEDLVGAVDGTPPDLSARKKTYLKSRGYGGKRAR